MRNQASRSHYVAQGNTNSPCAQNEHTPIANEPCVLDKSQQDSVVTNDNNPSNTDMTMNRSENSHTDSKNCFAVKESIPQKVNYKVSSYKNLAIPSKDTNTMFR